MLEVEEIVEPGKINPEQVQLPGVFVGLCGALSRRGDFIMADARMIIAKNIADMLKNGDFVNLGIGIPTMVSKFIDPKKTVLLHGENGSIGQDGLITGNRDEIYKFELTYGRENGDWQRGHRDLCNAGCDYITLLPGGCCFDSAMSFIMARGGHLDATVLGGLQVDTEGNLANWMVPGKRVNGMGGAMDLVCGAKRVIVAMEHTSKDGEAQAAQKMLHFRLQQRSA